MDSTYVYSESMGTYTARLLQEAIKSARRRSQFSPRQSPSIPYDNDSGAEQQRAEQKQQAHDDEEQTAAHFAASKRRPSTPLRAVESFESRDESESEDDALRKDEEDGEDEDDSRRGSAAPTLATLMSRKASTTGDSEGQPQTPPESLLLRVPSGQKPPANTPVHVDGHSLDHLDEYYDGEDDDEDYGGSFYDEGSENAYIEDDAYDVEGVEDKLESLTLNQSHDGSRSGPLRSGRDLVDEHMHNVEAFKAREIRRLKTHVDLEKRSWSVG